MGFLGEGWRPLQGNSWCQNRVVDEKLMAQVAMAMAMAMVTVAYWWTGAVVAALLL